MKSEGQNLTIIGEFTTNLILIMTNITHEWHQALHTVLIKIADQLQIFKTLVHRFLFHPPPPIPNSIQIINFIR